MSASDSAVLGPTAKPKLYSVLAIDIATVLGSWLAGAVLISRNYSRLGDRDAARNALIFGIAGTVALAVVVLSIVVPENAERALRYGLEGIQVGTVHLLTSRFQGAALKSHAAGGGEFFSRWRAVGIALLVVPVVLALFVALTLVFPNLPAVHE